MRFEKNMLLCDCKETMKQKMLRFSRLSRAMLSTQFQLYWFRIQDWASLAKGLTTWHPLM